MFVIVRICYGSFNGVFFLLLSVVCSKYCAFKIVYGLLYHQSHFLLHTEVASLRGSEVVSFLVVRFQIPFEESSSNTFNSDIIGQFKMLLPLLLITQPLG